VAVYYLLILIGTHVDLVVLVQLCHEATDLDPADLRLHHKVVILGGGKQAHMRGGDLRRVVIHGAALHGDDVMDVFHRLANDHPAVGGRATRIQTIFRGFINRKKRDEEKKKNEAEFDSDKEDGEEKDGKGESKEEGKEEAKAEEGKGEEKAEEKVEDAVTDTAQASAEGSTSEAAVAEK
jgi:hypothetical protein